MYKTIFIDVDGTLRNSKGEITPRTISSIRQITDTGMKVILTSGRSRTHMLALSKACGASCFVISSNGADVYDSGVDQVIYQDKMEKEDIIYLYELAERQKAHFTMCSGFDRVCNRVERFDGSEKALGESIEMFVHQNIVNQCIIGNAPREVIQQIKAQIEQEKSSVKIINQSPGILDNKVPLNGCYYLDIVNRITSKGNAIMEFCRNNFIDIDETIGIGDSQNDVSMFKVVGESVAMGNASPEIQRLTNRIIPSNDKEGVAVYLEELLDRYHQGEFFGKY